jgi:hypothetical protein
LHLEVPAQQLLRELMVQLAARYAVAEVEAVVFLVAQEAQEDLALLEDLAARPLPEMELPVTLMLSAPEAGVGAVLQGPLYPLP